MSHTLSGRGSPGSSCPKFHATQAKEQDNPLKRTLLEALEVQGVFELLAARSEALTTPLDLYAFLTWHLSP